MRVSAKTQVYFLFWLNLWRRGGSRNSETVKNENKLLDLTRSHGLFLCLLQPQAKEKVIGTRLSTWLTYLTMFVMTFGELN